MTLEDYRGVKVLAAYSHIPDIHWGLVVKQDLKEVYDPVKGMLFYAAMRFLIAALFVFGLSLFLARTISRPIIEITETAQKIRKGDLSARSHVTGVDEPALLALSFNDMARAVQTQEELNHINDEITRTMLEAENVNTFRADFLKKLVMVTSSQMGAYFLLNPETDRFEIFTSIGIDHELVSSFDIPSLEGDLGLALESQKITCIKDIPDDTVFSFKTFTGRIKPPHGFDLLLTDMTMPGMTGETLAKKVNALRPDLGIIMCTGFSESINREKALATGVKGFHMKPVLMRDMADTVRSVLDEP